MSQSLNIEDGYIILKALGIEPSRKIRKATIILEAGCQPMLNTIEFLTNDFSKTVFRQYNLVPKDIKTEDDGC